MTDGLRTPRLSTTWLGATSTLSSSPLSATSSPSVPSPRSPRGEYNYLQQVNALSETSRTGVGFYWGQSLSPRSMAIPSELTSARAVTDYQRAMGGSQRQMTHHSLTSQHVEKESFDSVYSDLHSHMDTASALGADLVPRLDVRTRATRPKDLRSWDGEHVVQTGFGPRAVLPSRSFVLWGDSHGPGRHIDF